ncbi:MAG: TetR/AcrR family transcriptional regulator [Spirochaetota bacterium]
MDYTFVMTLDYHHRELRNSLLESGRRLLLADGYAQFSLRKLAASLGVSHNAPYRHFASREELIVAIVRKDADRFHAALAAGVSGVDEPEERLYRLGEAYIFFFLDNPEVLLLFETLPGQVALNGAAIASLFIPPCHDRGAIEDKGRSEDGYRLLEDAVKPFSARFPLLSDEEIVLGYWAKVHGLASLLVSQRDLLATRSIKERVKVLVRTPF